MIRVYRSKVLTDAVETLSLASTMPAITRIVAEAARKLVQADGATFVLRDEGKCFYADEDALSPLWKGKRFPLEACISGWSMLNRAVVVIDDIYKDDRIPHDAYRPTFVKSLCMVPIRPEAPIGAIGNYWANGYCPSAEQIKLLQTLANSTAIALENLELKQSVQKRSMECRDLSDQKDDLESAIHVLAHDLKSPLASMVAFIQVLQSRLHDQVDDEVNGFFDSILKTGKQTSQQIQKMLSLYSVTNRQVNKQPVDLTEMGTEIFERLRVQDPSRNVAFSIEPGLKAFADPPLIHLALENLIGNAFKYTGKKANAEIHVGHSSDSHQMASFFVQDNGDGFNADQAHKLFRPLVRLHDDSEFAGTGLGLASVARIIELHGGKIWAEGRKQEGAIFHFALPYGSQTNFG